MSEERQNKMRSIRNEFSSRRDAYDMEIARSVPNYLSMLEAAVNSLPFEDGERPKVVDLGTGTGALAEKVARRFPNCTLTCVDMTGEMLEMAKQRLGGHGDITFVEKDFYDIELPDDNDAVVSSLALHHLITDDDKRSFYAKVFRSLRPGGVFVNADAVLSTDDWVEDLYMRKWKEFMRTNMSEDEMEAVLDRYRREDSLPRLMDQLGWLTEVGFSKVDIIWKDHMGAVVWARK